MTKSMTAYGQANINTELGELSCELRSVNHRYLEIAPRMPEELRIHESALRETISNRLARGKVDCFIRLQGGDVNQEVNPEMVTQLKSLELQLLESMPNMQTLRANDVLRWPGVLQNKKVAPEVMKVSLLTVVEAATQALLAAREQEGKKMETLIQQRLESIYGVIDEVTTFLPDIVDGYRKRLEEKLVDIKDQLEPTRLEQEMVLFLQKSDVAEELDRLKVHVEEVANVLNGSEPCGRRLDFLMQELNREANTLGSKAQDTRLTKASVDLKVYIEQMREQVQNIE